MDIFYVGTDRGRVTNALFPFEEAGYGIVLLSSPEEALAEIRSRRDSGAQQPSLLVFDAVSLGLQPTALREAAKDVLRLSAFTLLTAVSDMAAAPFHEAMEGLGMLKPLPPSPTAADGERLLRNVGRLVNP